MSIVQKIILHEFPKTKFSEWTQILKIQNTDESKSASILIYNMSGSLVKRIEIENKGEASVFVNGSELQAGIYAYALLVDGKVIDTKTMVLTK